MRTKEILFALILLLFCGCNDYDDTALNDRIDNLETRLSKLESECTAINSNMASLQSIVDAVSSRKYITGMDELYGEDGTTVIGYTLKFDNGKPITIYHGKDGKDGTDGHTPSIGIEKAEDGVFYWTLDGEWLLYNGEKIRAIATDGQQGEAGKDGITPKLKIEKNASDSDMPYWYVSYDNGKSWTVLYSAMGESGQQGEAGKDGDSFFKSVTLSEDGTMLIITLNDEASTRYELPMATDAISSLTFIPRFDDGKASIEYRQDDGSFHIVADFKVLPTALAQKIASEWAESKENVEVDYTEVATRTARLSTLTVTDVTASDETEGMITVDFELPVEIMNKPFFFSLSAKTGNCDFTGSAYIPVYSDDLDEQLAYVPDPRPAPAFYGSLQYAWGDEFNTDGSVNTDLWEFEEGFKRGNEPQFYVVGDNNAIVKDGRLLITGKKERSPENPRYDPTSSDYRKNWQYGDYTSASIRTREKRFFLYGRAEVRAKIDPTHGAFPAIWTCGRNKDWPKNGEIDIMEFYPSGGVNKLTSNFAAGKNKAWEAIWKSVFTPLSYYEAKDPDWIKKYHIYSMDWDEEQITLYVDGEYKNSIKIEEFKNEDGSVTFRNPQYMWLNLALKNNGLGLEVSEEKPIIFEVDYFRLYQKVVDHIKPTKVKNFKATADGSLVNLTWSPSIDEGGAGLLRYDIYKNALGDGNFVESTTATSLMVQNSNYGVETTYYIQALDGAGNYSEPTEVKVTTSSGEGEEYATATSGKTYKIINFATGKTITNVTATDGKAYDYVGLADYDENNPKHWTLVQLADGWAIKDATEAMAIQVQAWSTSNGGKMIYYNYVSAGDNKQNHQRFNFERQSSGLYLIKNANSNKYLGVSSAEDGTIVTQYDKGAEGQYQYWKLVEK